ncbi:MAG: hypothetical protein KGJ84_01025 [Elusimicrobia bacterium]|nr:hypothetical protein [Elusimicrobiota bacterium]
MNRYLLLSLCIAWTAPAVAGGFAETAFNAEAFAPLVAQMKGKAASDRTGTAPAGASAADTFEALQSSFAGARKPSTTELQLKKTWRCYSILNDRGRTKVIDEVSFDEFGEAGGKLMSTGTYPKAALEYSANGGSVYSSFAAGKKGDMWMVPAYRAAGGKLVREVSILWYDFPLMNPAYILQTAPTALSDGEFGGITHSHTLATVYSYGTCVPQ